jgi:hypothetical protein
MKETKESSMQEDFEACNSEKAVIVSESCLSAVELLEWLESLPVRE